MQRLLHHLFDLLLPQRCVGCGTLGENLCRACTEGFTVLSPLKCPLCNTNVAKPYTLCRKCAIAYPRLRGIVTIGAYAGPLRQAIHQFKYRSRTSLARELGTLLCETLIAAEIPDCAAIVPVPLHPAREAARGFNQAALISGQISEVFKTPILNGAAERIVDTPPQVGLSREQRLRNVAGAFATPRGAFSRGGMLLVDDVATTGATLVTCARTLTHEGGAPWVWGAVLARG